MNRGALLRLLSVLSFVPLLNGIAAAFLPAAAQTAPSNRFTPGEIATGSCWIDAATGTRVDTYPPGTHVIDMPDPNHATRPASSDGSVPGQDFVKLPDGSWIDSATGTNVNTYPAGTHVIDMSDPNHATRPTTSDGTVPGQDFVRVPCPPPPAPPAYWHAGVQVGAASSAWKYDDGFKIGGASPLLGIEGGVRFPASGLIPAMPPTTFFGVQFGLMTGLNSSTKEFAKVRLPLIGTAEAQIGTQLPFAAPSGPLLVVGGAGIAVADMAAGSTFPGFRFDNHQVASGFTGSVGIEIPVTPGISAVTALRYIDLPQTRFESPSGPFRLDVKTVIGTVGADAHF